jgi:hypothetical protein
MNPQALLVASGAGLVAQLAMVLSGHYVAFVKDKVFALGGMGISLIAGVLFAKLVAGAGWGPSLIGGAVAGGACALLAIAVSVGLKDTAANILLVGTLGSVVTGLIGGALGKLIA